MSHSATTVLLGSTRSSSKQGSEVFASSPATYPAGTAVRRNSSGLLSVAKADGQLIGISLGKDLSDQTKTCVLKSGEQVPLLIERQPARGIVTILNYANLVSGTDETITVGATVFTSQAGAATLGQATFRAETSNDATATSLAAQINAHDTAGALVKATAVAAVVTLTAILNTTAADTIALSYEAIGAGSGASVSGATLTDSDDSPDWVAIGAKVYISDSTGKADDPNSASTVSDAVYRSAVLSGVDEAGVAASCVIVDMAGGL